MHDEAVLDLLGVDVDTSGDDHERLAIGQEEKAVVQVAVGQEPSDALAIELLAYAKEHIAGFKVPRSMDFRDELPRLPTGKLYKRILRDEYWGNKGSKIV